MAMQHLRYSGPRASMAVSGNNIYLTWWDNKTGNNEVYFGASNDGGKSCCRNGNTTIRKTMK
jgi:hypothetical protein